MGFTLRLARAVRPHQAHGSPLSRSISSLNIVNAEVFDRGSVKPIHKQPFTWTISDDDDESWAVVGDGKEVILNLISGKLRISPSPQNDGLGIWPLLSHNYPTEDPFSLVTLASFGTRRRVGGGAFYDYTARYGGVREEDKITLRQSLEAELEGEDGRMTQMAPLTERLEISRFLDLPLIALSNGQTRRAHIVRHLLKDPKVLLLDEPLTGLDVHNRPLLLKILNELHAARRPRIILGLRNHDVLPEWITHVLVAQRDTVHAGRKEDMMDHLAKTRDQSGLQPVGNYTSSPVSEEKKRPSVGETVVDMKNLSVTYADRKVLRNIDWTIREGERWHLQGANGSGKTTLLSMISGDHPQSYHQPHLILFGLSRRKTSTVLLQQRIGSVSPEIFNAFPRRAGTGQGLNVRDAIGTGLHSTFSYRPKTAEDDERIDRLLEKLGPEQWGDNTIRVRKRRKEFEEEMFATLPVAEQAMVLLMRALVAEAPLLILDEPFAGMTDGMVSAAKAYLRDELKDSQAVIFVTHWEQEVPWSDVRRMVLRDGHATVQVESTFF